MQSSDIHITAPCVAELVSTRLPDLGEREVRIRLVFSTISSGTERANVIGDQNTAFDPDHQVHYPITDLGYSASGTVLEVAAEVTDLLPGDRVAVSWSHHGEIIQVNRAPCLQAAGVRFVAGCRAVPYRYFPPGGCA